MDIGRVTGDRRIPGVELRQHRVVDILDILGLGTNIGGRGQCGLLEFFPGRDVVQVVEFPVPGPRGFDQLVAVGDPRLFAAEKKTHGLRAFRDDPFDQRS